MQLKIQKKAIILVETLDYKMEEIHMKIIMKLCPDLNKLDCTEPAVVETKEQGIEIFAKDERIRNLIRKDYLLLGSSFEERIQKLLECKEKGEIFFSMYAPMARFELIEDIIAEQ